MLTTKANDLFDGLEEYLKEKNIKPSYEEPKYNISFLEYERRKRERKEQINEK